jgi:hypothetical protein
MLKELERNGMISDIPSLSICYDTDLKENATSNSSSTAACVFAAAGTV